MKGGSLQQISVVTSLEAEEAVVELLEQVFGRSAAVYTNEETRLTIASVYCQGREEYTSKERAALKAGLKKARASGLDVGAGRILARRVPKQDWSESWKRHFRPIAISSRLLIKPGWIKRRPRKNQAVVVLDPGLSFGTGNHPTTLFCLRELVVHRKADQRQAFWDVGTGSGILAIAAAKFGYEPVDAIDFDPEAIRVARQNARRNRVDRRIRFRRQDIVLLPRRVDRQYHLICANLISDLLLAEREKIVSRLRTDGTLVLAGILKKEFSTVQRAYAKAGLKLIKAHSEGEWRSGTFAAEA